MKKYVVKWSCGHRWVGLSTTLNPFSKKEISNKCVFCRKGKIVFKKEYKKEYKRC